jgi:hypothetical protein
MPFRLPSVEALARELYAADFRNNLVSWDAADVGIRDLFMIQAAKAFRMMSA